MLNFVNLLLLTVFVYLRHIICNYVLLLEGIIFAVLVINASLAIAYRLPSSLASRIVKKLSVMLIGCRQLNLLCDRNAYVTGGNLYVLLMKIGDELPYPLSKFTR